MGQSSHSDIEPAYLWLGDREALSLTEPLVDVATAIRLAGQTQRYIAGILMAYPTPEGRDRAHLRITATTYRLTTAQAALIAGIDEEALTEMTRDRLRRRADQTDIETYLYR